VGSREFQEADLYPPTSSLLDLMPEVFLVIAVQFDMAKIVNIDRDTPMLLPPDMRDWVPSNHLVH
jgi:hypothetical protein